MQKREIAYTAKTHWPSTMAKYKRHYKVRSKNNNEEEEEIQALEARVTEEAPKRGYAPPLHQQVAFRALPLSESTQIGLEEARTPFRTMTAIQNACIPHALAGRDILGAAKTGSGKSLAFVIPLLESLYRNRFRPTEGPGAIILSPVRELAVQIFELVRVVGAYHNLSAGLLVGGKKEFYLEQRHIGKTNILIATPGRLLQHLEQTPDLDTSLVRMLVLDEADRILDMGFRGQMIRILEYLPPGNVQEGGRQTLLFSATQTKKVSDLAALSLHQPEYLGVHDKEKNATPESLAQSMIVVPLEHKLNAVYSFIKSHLKTKCILFMASCSQVRHAWELFCALQPGIPIMAIHGKLPQEKRTKVYFDFLRRNHAVLFSTDVSARGLDFPNVDWVVQIDAPDDRDTYIHRAGRTARYNAGGKSLLMLTPGEEKGMTKQLQDAKVPIRKLSINPTKTVLVTQRAASLVASNTHLNTLAKKAFKSYTRSVSLMPNKDVFRVEDLPLIAYAGSLGLATAPSLRFLQNVKDRADLREKKNVNHKLDKLKAQIKAEKLAKKIAKMGGKRPRDDRKASNPDGDEDDLLVVKKKHEWDKTDTTEPLPKSLVHEVTKSRHSKKIRIEGGTGQNKRIVFNDDGEEKDMAAMLKQDDTSVVEAIRHDREALEDANEDYIEQVRERLQRAKHADRFEEKHRVREKHRKLRMRDKAAKSDVVDQGGMAVTLASGASDDESSVFSSGSQSCSGDGSDEEQAVDIKTQEELALALIRSNR